MLRRRTAQGAFAIALLTLGPALAACALDDDPAPPTPTADGRETSASTSVDPVVRPIPDAAMTSPDEVGAAAAAEYFVQLYDYSFASGNLEPWNGLASETCDFCRDIAADVAEIGQSGNRTLNEPTSIVTSRVWMIEPAKWFGADLIVREAPSTQVDATGATVATDDGGEFRLALALSWADGWKVDEVDVLDPDETPKW
ncbi:hypothetical protein GXP71_20015 [Cellulomonas sp. H30R-01]|uniref:DUF6318 family protein n=1 Tax=Cellulomonas sp. H30R-01 TaxID=2704467 RepID=UPI00138C2B67|nr:DUF6318 family protein [Cellulomonas sp. H30R-01]QHT58136.1 hypothetical protein GXP71_20015 [Cellulomonas sp. H30R-01]